MKNYVLLLVLLILGFGRSLQAQTWDEMTDQEKVEKLKSFMEDNQKYMKQTLQLTDDQVADVENTNICFLSSLDRIATYGGTDSEKKKYAKSLLKYRSKMIEAIMGKEKYEKFQTYVAAKLQKAMAEQK